MLCCVGYHVALIERNISYITAYFDRQTHLPVKKDKQKAPQNFGERAGQKVNQSNNDQQVLNVY